MSRTRSQAVTGSSRFPRTTICWVLIALAAVVVLPTLALAQEGAEVGHVARPSIPIWWWIAPVAAIIALVFAMKFYKEVQASDEGDPDMIEIAGHVRDGAMAYLKRQYKVVTVVFIVLALILAFMAFGLKVQNPIVWFAFLTGGFFSGLCGYLGMRTATMASNRTAAGARKSLNDGLRVAFRAGAVMGLVVVGFGLIDITGWFLVLYKLAPQLGTELHLSTITVIMLTFGMGASTQALFARVGGGIYTKAADVGADLVGKVEAGIPEDDARNPATIADNVGDNVGDVAGMGADLYESYCGSILATAALGVAAAAALFGSETSAQATEAAIRFLATPMVLAGIGIILSIVGIYLVKSEEKATMAVLMKALNRGIWGSSILIALAAGLVCYLLLGEIEGVRWYGVWGSILAGLIGGLIIGFSTEYYTSYDYKPTRQISAQAITGPATIIIGGIAEGMKSTWAALATIIVAILLAYTFAGGGHEFTLGLYGVGIAAVGMLATLGITLATDAYGPIADNAGGNAEMTGQQPHVRERTDALDALGNTTAATGKGFAIGSAALTALALLAAYVEEVRFGQLYESRDRVVAAFEAPTPEQAVYLGFGKFGTWAKGREKENEPGQWEELATEEVMAFMALDVPAEIKDGLKRGETKVTLGPDGSKNTQFISTGTLPDGSTISLVPSRRASLPQFMSFYDVTLMNPKVLCGLFSGVLLAFLFCSLTMKAVGRAANSMMIECRRQFEKVRQALRNEGKDEAFVQNTDNWPKHVEVEGHRYPDYANCVHISTAGAQREMIFPSLLAIIVPVVVGLLFGVSGVMGLLAGGLTSGFAVAIFMANAGGAWDNAKKLIETYGKITAQQVVDDKAIQDKLPPTIRAELLNRAKLAVNAGRPNAIVYGKGSEDHKASVVGDTVGDPFKDTSGPSLNILIKLMSMVSVVFAGLIVKFAPQIGALLGLD
ncbi:MAG: sodium-translocating pyrophosphatase [Planctomycetes bacterium]|nr:sodium-translocating pyrophosphatase [Planctomycetota bacterium]